MIKFILLQIILFLSFFAQGEEINQDIVRQFNESIQNIKSVAVDFQQIDSNGAKAEGKLLINKPFEFRCNYYEPYPIVIIGNKNYVSIYDYEMENITRISSTENIFNFLLDDKVDFDRFFKIESTIDYEDVITVTIYHQQSDRRSKVTIDKNDHQLKELDILEDDNIITITFGKMAKVSKFDQDLFIIKTPNIFGAPSRFTKTDIEKKYTLHR